MSKYDQLAFAGRPNFYLAAPSTVDQSGSGVYTIGTNTLALGGQPIVYGHANSFKIQSGATATINGNLVFRTGVTTELVMLASRPIQETEIILANNGSGIFITPNSVVLRINYTKNQLAKSLIAEVVIADWHKKLHIVVTLGNNQAALTVNDESSTVSLDGTIDSNITTTSLGSTFSTGYYFLLDGFGVYSRKLFDKTDAVDDPMVGHNIFAASVLGGNSTDFTTYQKGETVNLTLDDFTFYTDGQGGSFIYNYSIPANENSASYVTVETNNDSLSVDWDLNGGNVGSFIRHLVVPVASSGSVLSFNIPSNAPKKFSMRLENVLSGNIFSQTPAKLVATGQPIFPAVVSDSIVNCPQGVNMRFASYSGSWLYADTATDVPPQSIELIFKPKETTSLGPNVLANPGFEPNVTSWTSSDATLSQDTTQVHSGNFAAKVVPSGAAIQSYISSENISVTPGVNYTVSVWVWITATNTFTCSIDWFNSAGAYLTSTSNGYSIGGGVWTQVTNTFTAPAGAAFGHLSAVLTGSPPATNIFYVDDASFSKVIPTVVLSSTDGQIDMVAQTGYTIWLNGASVANLNNVLMNQWNHLVLTKTSAAATSFKLNTDGSSTPNRINYLLLSSYPKVLVSADVQRLYNVSIGADIISVAEAPLTLAEGVFDNGQAFQLFGNSWAIVGAGGN